MKKRYTAKWIFAVWLCLCLMALPMIAMAQSTMLSTVIPKECVCLLKITGKGTVKVDGEVYHHAGQIVVERGMMHTISVTSQKGYALQDVSLDGVKLQPDEQTGEFSVLLSDGCELAVSFNRIASAPQTGDEGHVPLLFLTAICVLSGIGIGCTYRRKSKQTR